MIPSTSVKYVGISLIMILRQPRVAFIIGLREPEDQLRAQPPAVFPWRSRTTCYVLQPILTYCVYFLKVLLLLASSKSSHSHTWVFSRGHFFLSRRARLSQFDCADPSQRLKSRLIRFRERVIAYHTVNIWGPETIQIPLIHVVVLLRRAGGVLWNRGRAKWWPPSLILIT